MKFEFDFRRFSKRLILNNWAIGLWINIKYPPFQYVGWERIGYWWRIFIDRRNS